MSRSSPPPIASLKETQSMVRREVRFLAYPLHILPVFADSAQAEFVHDHEPYHVAHVARESRQIAVARRNVTKYPQRRRLLSRHEASMEQEGQGMK